MADPKTIDWEGKSGSTYRYWIYPIGAPLKAEPGNYVFARETTPNWFHPIYIGETGDLSERFDNHHKMPCIRQNRATEICAHTSSSNRDIRLAEERDLLAKWNPACND